MKTSNKLLLSLLALIFITTAAFMGTAKWDIKTNNVNVTESGQLTTEKSTVAVFTKLNVQGPIKVIFTSNGQPGVELKGDKNFVKNVKCNVKNGELIIEALFNSKSGQKVEVLVNGGNLEELTFSEGASFESEEVLKAPKIKLDFTTGSIGSVNINAEETILDCSTAAILSLTGSTGNLNITSSTGSIIKASGLNAKKGEIDGSTGSVMEVNISDEIGVDLSTGSVVNSLGNPVNKKMDLSTGGVFTKK